jgi:hypothetical protein
MRLNVLFFETDFIDKEYLRNEKQQRICRGAAKDAPARISYRDRSHSDQRFCRRQRERGGGEASDGLRRRRLRACL